MPMNGHNYFALTRRNSMRSFVAFLAHETNSFSPIPTDIRNFEEIGIYSPAMGNPEKHLALLKGAADFYNVAKNRGDTAVVGTCALGQPSAPCDRSTYEGLRDSLLDDLVSAGQVDMVLIMLHGSMMAEGYDDCEGDILSHIKKIVGPGVPIGVLLDLHCNITEAMLEHSTILMPCKEYPHTDFAQRSVELYDLISATARGEITPHTSFLRVPMLGLFQTTKSPMRELVDRTIEEEQRKEVLNISLGHGFPWSDFPEAGASVMVVTNNKSDLGQQLATSIGHQFFSIRHAANVQSLEMDAALLRLNEIPEGTVVMADMADNPGGGAAADSTYLLRDLIDTGVKNAAIALFWDPDAVDCAFAAGEGADIQMLVGGKKSAFSGAPLKVMARVKHLRSSATQPHIADGQATPLGRTAVIETSGIEIVLNDIRQQPFHPDAFINAGVDPWAKRVVVVKSSYHFLAGFSEKAVEVLYVESPGALNGDVSKRAYSRLKRPIWPLDEVAF